MIKYPENTAEEASYRAALNKKENACGNRWLWDMGASVGLIGGVCFFIGAVFMTVSEFFLSEKPRGSWMFLAVLPLWVIGAYCLDKTVDSDKTV